MSTNAAMAELEVTKEAYDQLLEKLKFWKEEQRRLLKQLAQEARHASDSPSHEALRLQAQVEEFTSRITQLDARLQSVRIIPPPTARTEGSASVARRRIGPPGHAVGGGIIDERKAKA